MKKQKAIEKKKRLKTISLFIIIFVGISTTYMVATYAPASSKQRFFKYAPARENIGTNAVVNATEQVPVTKNKVIMPQVNLSPYLNPKSPLFGRKYEYMEGKQSTSKDWVTFFKEYVNGLPRWETYFPKLIVDLNKLNQLNPEKNAVKSTSPFSYCTFPSGSNYKVGDMFKAKIQAVDFANKNKEFGGDYIRARLLKQNSAGATRDGVPCRLQDHGNGTYTISAPLLVPGVFTLEVQLVSSVEAVASLIAWSSERQQYGYVYDVTLQSNELVGCNIDLPLNIK